MPRFFAAGSDSDSDSSSSGDEIETRPIVSTKTFQWSDDEDDTKRVVKSAKSKRSEEMVKLIKNIRNSRKTKILTKIQSDFEDLIKLAEKHKRVFEVEGRPTSYIRCLAELEDFIIMCWDDKEGKKKMKKDQNRSLTIVREKLKKFISVNELSEELSTYKKTPEAQDGNVFRSDTEEEDSESEEEESNFLIKGDARTVKQSFAKTAATAEDSDSSDSMDWGSSDSDSSSDDEDYGGNIAAKFLKTTTEEKAKQKEKEKENKEAEKKLKAEKRAKRKEEDGAGWEKVKQGGGGVEPMSQVTLFKKGEEVTHENMLKKLLEVIATRGKKSSSGSMQKKALIELRSIAADNKLGPAMDVKILLYIISAIFDTDHSHTTPSMSINNWLNAVKYIEELVEILKANPEIVLGENVSDDSECYSGEKLRVNGCVLVKVERMDNEFTKILQNSDAHSTEYITRLRNEITVCRIIESLQEYLEGRSTTDETCRIYLKRIEHIYYKFDSAVQYKSTPEENKVAIEARSLIDGLCKYIYAKDSTDRIRTKAILCQIYYYSIHDLWYDARNLMLMSHLQDTIQHSDIPTQIMYNRAMCQLGLCAFRQGLIKDAHGALVDIQSVGRAKELLAQGLLLQRQYERTPEQEKIEKSRHIPFHMHINLELLECTYLVSAMLIEIPYMAAHEFDARRRMISKNFHHVLRVIDRQPLVGPPESMREHVVAASKAMKSGDWAHCRDYLINEKMDAKVWNLFRDAEKIKTMVKRKIQEESLRTYLFTYSGIYDSLNLQTLAEMFELEVATVHSSISKMIINDELMASLDEPTQSVMMHRTEPSPLQSLSLQLSEKIGILVENNERLLEAKNSGGFYFQNKGGQDYRNPQQRDARNRQAERGDGGSRRGGYGGYGGRGGRGGRGGNRGGYHNRGEKSGGYGGYNNDYQDSEYGNRRQHSNY